MKKYLLIITGILFVTILPLSFAEETRDPEAIIQDLHFKDPFRSLLPGKPKIKEIELITPIKQETKQEKVEPQVTIAVPALKITGIVWGSSRPQAIVNDKVVDIGSAIGEVTIVNITRVGIEISYKGERFMINPNIQTAQKNTFGLEQRTFTQ